MNIRHKLFLRSSVIRKQQSCKILSMFHHPYSVQKTDRSRSPRSLRRRSAAVLLFGSRVRIPPGHGLFVLCLLCFFQVQVSATGRSLVQRSPTVCVCVYDSECRAACCLVVHRHIFALTFHWLCFVVSSVPQVNHHVSVSFVVLVLINSLFSALLSIFIVNIFYKDLP